MYGSLSFARSTIDLVLVNKKRNSISDASVLYLLNLLLSSGATALQRSHTITMKGRFQFLISFIETIEGKSNGKKKKGDASQNQYITKF
jgi:hypothetical protein